MSERLYHRYQQVFSLLRLVFKADFFSVTKLYEQANWLMNLACFDTGETSDLITEEGYDAIIWGQRQTLN